MMNSCKGFHVRTVDGRVYGVAADGKTDARRLAHARMAADGVDSAVAGVDALGVVGWDYGTVIAY